MQIEGEKNYIRRSRHGSRRNQQRLMKPKGNTGRERERERVGSNEEEKEDRENEKTEMGKRGRKQGERKGKRVLFTQCY